MGAMELFMERLKADAELLQRAEDCESVEELYELAKEFGVKKEEIAAIAQKLQ